MGQNYKFKIGDSVTINPQAIEKYDLHTEEEYRSFLTTLIGKPVTVADFYHNPFVEKYCFRTSENCEEYEGSLYCLYVDDFDFAITSEDVCDSKCSAESLFQ